MQTKRRKRRMADDIALPTPRQLRDEKSSNYRAAQCRGHADEKKPRSTGHHGSLSTGTCTTNDSALLDPLWTAASAVDNLTPSGRITTRKRIGFCLLALHRRSPIDGSAPALTLRNGSALVVEREKQLALRAAIGRATAQGFCSCSLFARLTLDGSSNRRGRLHGNAAPSIFPMTCGLTGGLRRRPLVVGRIVLVRRNTTRIARGRNTWGTLGISDR